MGNRKTNTGKIVAGQISGLKGGGPVAYLGEGEGRWVGPVRLIMGRTMVREGEKRFWAQISNGFRSRIDFGHTFIYHYRLSFFVLPDVKPKRV